MAADLLSDEQISDFKDAFTLFDTGRILFFLFFYESTIKNIHTVEISSKKYLKSVF